MKNSVPLDLLHVLSHTVCRVRLSLDTQIVTHTSVKVKIGKAILDGPVILDVDNHVKENRFVDSNAKFFCIRTLVGSILTSETYDFGIGIGLVYDFHKVRVVQEPRFLAHEFISSSHFCHPGLGFDVKSRLNIDACRVVTEFE